MPDDPKSPQTHTHLESTYQQSYSLLPVALLVFIFALAIALAYLEHG